MQLAKKKLIGFTGVLLLSFLLLLIFYGKILFSLNTVFFSLTGDGIQSYFNSTYLVQYDSSLFYSHSMNHPYGELSFYTQAQPLVMGAVKVLSKPIPDTANYIVGIVNSLMLMSIVLGAIFLFAILYEIGMPVMFSTLASVGIAFLSPQIDRMGGHFTLSFVWAIPLLIYLLMLFDKEPKLIYSVMMGIALFVLITAHIYFAVFYFVILAAYWLFKALYSPRFPVKKYLWMLIQFSVQFLMPVFVFYIITGIYNHLVPDRPSNPYGFLIYKATPESIFLPVDLEYGKYMRKIFNFSNVQWEGIGYIGIVSVIGFLIIMGISAIRLLRQKWVRLFEVTDKQYLNILFWSALLLLIYSFGIPFIFNLEFLIDYLGPLKQLRALGRFAWLYFYVINIVVFYKLWQWQNVKPGRRVILWGALFLLFLDVFYYNKGNQNLLNNRYAEWTDRHNKLPENNWAASLDPLQYQAILPLPYYHMGSDNFNIPVRCNMLTHSYLVSVKTGLPVTAIYVSRASVSQTVKNIALPLEPYRKYEILKDLSSKKPFLVVAARCNDLTIFENNLLRHCTPIDSNSFFTLYRLELDSLQKLPERKFNEVKKVFGTLALENNIMHKSIPGAKTASLDFNGSSNVSGYQGQSLLITGRSVVSLHDKKLGNDKNTMYSLSFWLNPVNRDLVPKTRLLVTLSDVKGTQYGYFNVMCGDYIKTFDGAWGLVEYQFLVVDSADRIQVFLYNEIIGKERTFKVDEVLLKPEICSVFTEKTDLLMMNNRWYPKSRPLSP